MIKEMAQIAAECFRTPTQLSVWSPKLNRYVCPSEEKVVALDTSSNVPPEVVKHPSVDPQFKLVFLTSVIVTSVFAILCVVLTFAAGKEPRPLFEKVIMWLMDLIKVGIGAAVGLLGGKKLQAKNSSASQ